MDDCPRCARSAALTPSVVLDDECPEFALPTAITINIEAREIERALLARRRQMGR